MMFRKVLLPVMAVCWCACWMESLLGQDPRVEIAKLEQRIRELPAGEFDWAAHNELRHLYLSIDPKKSMEHVDIILAKSPLDGYMKTVLVGTSREPGPTIQALVAIADQNPTLVHLNAACRIWAAELMADPKARRGLYANALKWKDLPESYRALILERQEAESNPRRPWPKKIAPPQGMKDTPGPWNDSKDLAIWPNEVSRANSDPWLVANHDRIRVMKPRLLLINFSNEHSDEHLQRLTQQLIEALAESSRYHGYRDPKAPPFLQYQVFKYVDLRDANSKQGNSQKIPVKDIHAKSGFNMRYRSFFSKEFAELYGVRDPRDNSRFLRLDELLDGGFVHEVWFFESGNTNAVPFVGSFEVVEQKPRYDAQFQRIGDEWVQAGNGGDSDQPWVGRSCRIGCVNASRGIGCFLESLAHGIEGNSNSNAIPYFTRYFREYADFNLRERYGLPFESLYAVAYNGERIQYPKPDQMILMHDRKKIKVDNYVPAGGNAHFPPNARGHYDLDNPYR